MIIPIRCFTCNKVIAHLWDEYNTRVNQNGECRENVMKELGLKLYCCRRMIMSHKDIIDELLKYPSA